MKPFSRSIMGLAGGILVLGALATISFVSVIANQQANLAPVGGFAGGEVVAMGSGMMGAPGATMQKEIVFKWEKPSGPPPSWLDQAVGANEKEETIRSSLNDRMDINLMDTPLSEVIEFIGNQLNVPFFIDDKALEAENITPDEPITIKRKDAKVRHILTQVLEPLQLTYRVELEAVFITSQKSSANEFCFYDLSSIFPDNGLIMELLSGIQNMIAPDSWVDAGGTSSMRTIGSILVISAPNETHLVVERFLQEVSKQPVANLKPRTFVDKPEIKSTESEKPIEKR